MPRSATERFGRTYTPRVPDDDYDALGPGVTDWIVDAPQSLPVQTVTLRSGCAGGQRYQVIVQSGQRSMVSFATSMGKASQLSTTAIKAPVQTGKAILTATMAGGTLH